MASTITRRNCAAGRRKVDRERKGEKFNEQRPGWQQQVQQPEERCQQRAWPGEGFPTNA
jgi:hypothetical protein